MRIIAGKVKNRGILSIPRKSGLRPMLARIRQSLFDILRPRIVESDFLDLYAGTGSVGLEALSRGARSAVFVEKDKACIHVIRKNLERLGFTSQADVYCADVLGGFPWVGGPFDIVFMGPPYKDLRKQPLHLTGPTLDRISQAGLLVPGGWVVAQHHAKEHLKIPAGWFLFRQEKYGDSRLSFFKRISCSEV